MILFIIQMQTQDLEQKLKQQIDRNKQLLRWNAKLVQQKTFLQEQVYKLAKIVYPNFQSLIQPTPQQLLSTFQGIGKKLNLNQKSKYISPYSIIDQSAQNLNLQQLNKNLIEKCQAKDQKIIKLQQKCEQFLQKYLECYKKYIGIIGQRVRQFKQGKDKCSPQKKRGSSLGRKQQTISKQLKHQKQIKNDYFKQIQILVMSKEQLQRQLQTERTQKKQLEQNLKREISINSIYRKNRIEQMKYLLINQ